MLITPSFPFLWDLDPVLAEVQVPPEEPRGRRRSAHADVDIDPLFGVQVLYTLRGGPLIRSARLGLEFLKNLRSSQPSSIP
jgi:hypothetical protein